MTGPGQDDDTIEKTAKLTYYHSDKDAKKPNPADEGAALLPGGGPRVSSAVSGRKARGENAGFAGVGKAMSGFAGEIAAYGAEYAPRRLTLTPLAFTAIPPVTYTHPLA